jgi:hypothetical protein
MVAAMRLGLALSVIALAGAASAATRTVTFPLVLDYPILEAALRRDLGMTEGTSLELWGTPGSCHWAVADEIAMTPDAGALRLVVKGSTVVGFRLLWFCLSPIAWQGSLSLVAQPVVGRDWQLHFETSAVEARDPDGNPSPLTNGALQVARGRIEDRLNAFHYDLGPPADEAKALVRAAASGERGAAALRAIDTLRPIETVAEPDGVRVRIAMDVDEAEAPPPAPEGGLSDTEVRAWEDRLNRWDAFLLFVVKTLGIAETDKGVRNELFAILLDGRRDLVDVLRQGPVPGTDPVRNLFLTSWDRLRVQTRRAVRDGVLGDRAFRFVTFLAAGDALAALDQAGPGLGLEISADGLRRLARVVAPERADPIAPSEAVDPELQKLFGFQDPAEETAPARPATTALPPTGAPSTTAPPTSATTAPPTSTTTPAPTSTTLDISWLWSPRTAAAATPPVDLVVLGKRLDRWIPADTELSAYRDAVDQLLATTATHRVDRVDRALRPVYRSLVPSVAWQESCWRQFVERNGAVTFLRSATGDVGIMQVNRRVWRGFFDVKKLEWDMVYNAAAGAEILVQLLGRFGAQEGTTLADNAARATYAAYNGGPSAYARYRSPKASALGKAIDGLFYDKYKQVAGGVAGDLVLCM